MLESDYTAIFNDKDKRAQQLIRKNLEHNGIDAEVLGTDANLLMRQRHFQHVDIDPFGSPAEFIDSACFSATKYLSVTATDTAALCGSAKISGLRKYSAFAKKTEYYAEVGMRMLIGKIAREATKYDKGIEVLISWAKEHYYRLHLKIRRSVSFAGKIYRKVGYLFHCPNCGRRKWTSMLEAESLACECGKAYTIIGPLWLGELHKKDFVSKMIEKADDERIRFLKRILEELEIPFYYDIHAISKSAGISPPSIEDFKKKMNELGYKFSRTRFSGTSFKTNAELEKIYRILNEMER